MRLTRPGVLVGYKLCADGKYRKTLNWPEGITIKVETLVRNARGQLLKIE